MLGLGNILETSRLSRSFRSFSGDSTRGSTEKERAGEATPGPVGFCAGYFFGGPSVLITTPMLALPSSTSRPFSLMANPAFSIFS